MEIISFEQVIDNIEKGKMEVPEIITENTFVLVSNDKWTLNQKDSFEKLISHIQFNYDLNVKIIGGGKSCSKIIIELDPSDDTKKELIDRLLIDLKLHEVAIEMNVEWIIRVATNESLNLKTGQVTNISNYNIDNLYKIYKINNMDNQSFSNSGSISQSNVNANLKNSFIETHSKKDELVQAITDLEAKIKELEVIVDDNSELEKVKEDFNDLKEELSKPKPKRKFLNVIMNSLSTVKSLTTIVEKIAEFLPIV